MNVSIKLIKQQTHSNTNDKPKVRFTPGVKEPRLPASVSDFLLAALRGGHQGAEVIGRNGVVEDENVGASGSGPLNPNRLQVIMAYHGPNFVLCEENNIDKHRRR